METEATGLCMSFTKHFKDMNNPKEKKVLDGLKAKRKQAIQQKARKLYEKKDPSDNLYTMSATANVGAFLVHLISFCTGFFASYYILSSEFFVFLPYVAKVIFSAIGGISFALFIEYAKSETSRIAWTSYYDEDIKPLWFLAALGIALFSVGLASYTVKTFPHYIAPAPVLASIADIDLDYQSKIETLRKDRAQFRKDRLYLGKLSSKDIKEYNKYTENIKELEKQKAAAIALAKTDNQATEEQHKENNNNRGEFLVWVVLLLELLIYPLCNGFKYYYYNIVNEETNPTPPNASMNTIDSEIERFFNGSKYGGKNEGNQIGFHKEKDNTKTIINVRGQKRTDLPKMVVEHIKQDGKIIEVDKRYIEDNIRKYNFRLSETIAEVQLQNNITKKKLSALSNRFHTLDYWVRKQGELMSVYDQNLNKVT